MSKFIESLENRAKEDSRVRAILRRSLSFEAGFFPPAYPYVEAFIKGENTSSWKRQMYYLIAGLWAANWNLEAAEEQLTIAVACAKYTNYKSESISESTEKRLIALLAADEDQLAYRLRSLVMLLKEYRIDFSQLLFDVLDWGSKEKKIQVKWAREFYNNAEQ